MDIFDGPNWFGIAFNLLVTIPLTMITAAMAAAVWILVGSMTAWNALIPRKLTPMFPREAGDELSSRRRIIWTVRGFVAGWPIAAILQLLTTVFTIPSFDDSREWFSSNSDWFLTALPAVGATVGAALAARFGTKRTDELGKPKLGDYVPRWMWITSTASVVLILTVLAIANNAGSEELFASALGLSALLAVLALATFVVSWRVLLTRSAGGPSAAWADATRATALWFLVSLPVMFVFTGLASLADHLPVSAGASAVPFGIVLFIVDFLADLFPQTILIVALGLAPLLVTRERHPEYYAAMRSDWSATRRWFASLRGARHRRRNAKAPADLAK